MARRALLRGELKDGVLDGDLVLQGGGDPYMTLERWWSFVHALRARGLKTIRGDIVIDNTAFAVPPEDPGAFDGRPHRAYNLQPDALMVNFQSVEFTVAPNAATHRVDVVATPSPVNLAVENRIDFAAGPCSERTAVVEFEVASDIGIEWCSAARCPRIARSAASRACCSGLPPTRSARSSSCGRSWAVNSTASCASRRPRRMLAPSSPSTPSVSVRSCD